MLDSERESDACSEFNKKIQIWGLKPETTWIVAVANSEEVDGSTAGLQKLKNKVMPYEDWHSRFIPNIPTAVNKIENGDNVVLFDDFIGSGKKFVRKVAWLKRLLEQNGVNQVSVYCSCFVGMKLGVEYVEKQLNTHVFNFISLSRGIADNYSGQDLMAALETMKAIEGELLPSYRNKKIDDYSFGYEKSEALYCAINDNCPNNVFPIFWWPKKNSHLPASYGTLLRRAG